MLIPLRHLFVAFAFAGLALSASAASVQGQLLCNNGTSRATSVAVTLVPVNTAAASRTRPFFTGADGMYYLQGLAPGRYQLEIWLSRNSRAPSLTYPVDVRDPSTVLNTRTLPQCTAR